MLGTGPPFDESGPAVQACELPGEVVDPLVLGHPKLLEDMGDDALRLFVLFQDATDVQAVQVERHVSIGHVAPRRKQAALATRHIPNRLAFIKEVQTALNHQFVEFSPDLGAVQRIHRFINGAIAKQSVMQMPLQRLRGRVLHARFAVVQEPMQVPNVGQRVWPGDRLADFGHQHCQPMLQIDPRDLLARREKARYRCRQQRTIDLTGGEISLIGAAGQKGAAMEQLCALAGGLVEGQVFEPVQGVVVDEGAHRPEERNRLCGNVDHRANLEAQAEPDTHK